MRFFYDTEFIEDGRTIDLISIGIAAENGAIYYAQNLECQFARASAWVQQYVFPHLRSFDQQALHPIIGAGQPGDYVWRTREELRDDVFAFCNTGLCSDEDPTDGELWGYYSAYDHVAFCQLFGTMMQLPPGWPMLTYDLRQELDRRRLFGTRQPETVEAHDALADAQWIRRTYRAMMEGDPRDQ